MWSQRLEKLKKLSKQQLRVVIDFLMVLTDMATRRRSAKLWPKFSVKALFVVKTCSLSARCVILPLAFLKGLISAVKVSQTATDILIFLKDCLLPKRSSSNWIEGLELWRLTYMLKLYNEFGEFIPVGFDHKTNFQSCFKNWQELLAIW